MSNFKNNKKYVKKNFNSLINLLKTIFHITVIIVIFARHLTERFIGLCQTTVVCPLVTTAAGNPFLILSSRRLSMSTNETPIRHI